MGPSTGVIEMTVPEIRVDLKQADSAGKGTYCSVPVSPELLEGCEGKLRRSDKVYIWSEEPQAKEPKTESPNAKADTGAQE